jgi:hypothetical protein
MWTVRDGGNRRCFQGDWVPLALVARAKIADAMPSLMVEVRLNPHSALRMPWDLSLSPLIRLLPIVQATHASNVRSVPVLFGPFYRFGLGFERCQDVVRMVLNHKIFNRTLFTVALRARFDENNGHVPLPEGFMGQLKSHTGMNHQARRS